MLSNTNKIDLVSRLPDSRGYEVSLIVEEGEWGLPGAKELLEEKGNSYLAYILNGQMKEDFPDMSPDAVEIVVHHVDEMPDEIRKFVELVRIAISREGVPVRVEQL